MTTRILVLDDSDDHRTSVKEDLKSRGYAVDSAVDGDLGLSMMQSNEYDLAIIERDLPEKDGLSVLTALRETECNIRVLMISNEAGVEDRVQGLRAGADDYLVKPFAMRELGARVDALSRRFEKNEPTEVSVGDLKIFLESKSVTRAGKSIELTARDFRILEVLARRVGEVVSAKEIEEVFSDNLVRSTSNVVVSAVYQLRKKLSNYKGAPQLVHTRRG
ncbi:MAG: response regulator transcription factor, partial [Verrucomicrobiota bacterium]